MGRDRKGVQGIRTMGALVDSRRTRTAAGALLELSAMANEKLLLHKELERGKVRQAEIGRRLAEIAGKEQRLMALVQSAPSGSIGVVGKTTTVTSGAMVEMPSEPPPGRRVKVEEFTY